uniref:Myb-like domain-containing protein n=1 Tax=Oryza meridionalis TaxID=40149 RepID=A0A0E0CZK9_9ORYZ
MENGSRHWRRVAAQIPRRRRRSPVQCRDRWRDHLARDVFHRPEWALAHLLIPRELSSSSSTTVASSPASPLLGWCVVCIRLPPAWTPEEDAILERLAMENGSRHWRRVAAQIPRRRRRSPVQCRDRWRDHLARDVFHRPFTSADDTELARLCLRLDDACAAAGHRWKHVSRAVYGRSSCAVKRRWRKLRKSDAFLSALWRPRTTAPTANAAITTTC